MKKINVILGIIFLAAAFTPAAYPGEKPVEIFETGKITEKVTCLADNGQNYALYLPNAYSKDKKWPILFAFEPAARVKIPLELFKPAAEKYGYIIACPHNARNGPWEPVINAMKAVWKDTVNRFSIDYNRIYATGFSGGARAAALFPKVVGKPAAGIIACGAGLPPKFKAEQVRPSFYYGIVGLRDFNYKEFVRLAGELQQAGIHFIIDIIDGPHDWPPPEVCQRAFACLEVDAVKKGLKSKNETQLDTLYKEISAHGENLEKAGKVYHAVSFYKYLIRLFSGLQDTAALLEKITRLEQSKAFKDFAAEEKIRNNKENAFIGRFAYVFSLARNAPLKQLKLKKVFKDLELDRLIKMVAEKDNIYDSAMAFRLLLELIIKGNREGSQFREKGDAKRAEIFLAVAERAREALSPANKR